MRLQGTWTNGQTDGLTGWFLFTPPPNFVCGEYKNHQHQLNNKCCRHKNSEHFIIILKALCFSCALSITKQYKFGRGQRAINWKFPMKFGSRGPVFFRKECYGHRQMTAPTTKDDKLRQYNTLPFGSDELKYIYTFHICTILDLDPSFNTFFSI